MKYVIILPLFLTIFYVPDYDAAEDDDLYNATCQQGIEFDAYNDIKVNCTGYDEQDNFTGIKKWKDVKTMDPELMETIVKKMKWKSPTPIQKYRQMTNLKIEN